MKAALPALCLAAGSLLAATACDDTAFQGASAPAPASDGARYADAQATAPSCTEVRGLVGKVYRLDVGTPKLPNFDAMTAVGQITAPNLDVPPRDWLAGFPALPDLVEWVGISFTGRIDTPVDGLYQFRVTADDGANLYLDGRLVVDDDGLHGAVTRQSLTLPLARGSHDLRVDWFQGPRTSIALQVLWRTPQHDFAVVRQDELTARTDCELRNLGNFPSRQP